MKFDSIKSRLVLMTLVCVVGMALLVTSQHYFTQRLIGLNQQRDLLLRMGQDLLQMRRHEKDFLLRQQHEYFQLFTERSDRFSARLDALTPLFGYYEMPTVQLDSLAESLDEYQRLFQQVVTLQTDIGLTASAGLIGRLTTIETQMQESVSSTSGTLALFDEIRLATRDFQLTKNNYFATLAIQRVSNLNDTLSSEPMGNVAERLSAYEEALISLIQAHQRLGLTHDEGLIGRFRRQAHSVESQLTQIDNALQPVIEAQEHRVKLYSISIAVLTSILLILLLIKSFATFHRAFANFVMFFYRCKRQYQKIDPRKLGFAEFKSLAELANEMVESRRDIEARLAVVEAELAQQEKQSS